MSLDLYPSILHQDGEISPDTFGSEIDEICDEIEEACKGFGTNEARLLKAVGSMTPEQRCKVPVRYQQKHGKKLSDVMNKECGSRDFGTALQFLCMDPLEADCAIIDRASKGPGTAESVLFPVICGRTNKEMEMLKKKYFELSTKDLSRKLDSELGGALEQLVLNVIQADEKEYDPSYHTEAKMMEDAEKLYSLGQGKRGTDEAGLFKILCAAPAEYLEKLNLKYADKYGYTLVKMLEKELAGDVQKAATFMMGMKLKPYEEVAKLINAACAGLGTNELLLTSSLIRYQTIMKHVILAHVDLYGKTILDRIKEETKGDYKRLLVEVMEAIDN